MEEGCFVTVHALCVYQFQTKKKNGEKEPGLAREGRKWIVYFRSIFMDFLCLLCCEHINRQNMDISNIFLSIIFPVMMAEY